MSFLVDVASNIVANAAFWLLLGAVVWLAGKAGQARFTRWFGTGASGRVVVVLSNMWKRSPTGRPEGYAIGLHESLAAQSVNALLGSAPLRLPDIVRGLVDALWSRSRLECVVEVSPPTGGELEATGTLVVVGAATRNSVRRRHLEQGLPRATFVAEHPRENGRDADRGAGHGTGPTTGPTTGHGTGQEVVVRRGGGDLQRIRSQHGVAVVEKIVLRDRGQSVFYCFGSRGDTTWLATEYLVRHWRQLAREFGDDPFVVCLGIPLPQEYHTEYHEPMVLASIRP
ncbi:hypothetical protein [Actinoplanes sp. NPDC051494]|uniref:hypothetical protein n=1 Tax=Actinoplanes sp. NPDC051494 TaxID=3363907 RepID=UPI0037A23166